MSGIFDMPFTPTIGKETFLRGPTYSIKTDFNALVSRKKEICFPDTIPVTHRSADSLVAGLYDLGLVSHLVETSVLDLQLGSYWKFEAMNKEKTVFPEDSPSSSVPIVCIVDRSCHWLWVKASFCLMSWVSTVETGLRGLFSGSIGWVFGQVWDI
jgi:hypothetical protein